MNLQITNDTKLTGVELRLFLNMKRRKTDQPISSMEMVDMLALWKEWKTRPVEAPQYDHDLVESVHEVSNDGNDTTTDEITNSKDGEENAVISIQINNYNKIRIFDKCRYPYLISFHDQMAYKLPNFFRLCDVDHNSVSIA